MPDNPNISPWLVEDIRKKSHCPFCRLVIIALGGPEIPSFEDGEPVTVVMSWSTNGRLPDINQPWNHTPKIRLLRPYAQKQGGGYVRSERLDLFPEITLLANDPHLIVRVFRQADPKRPDRFWGGTKLDIDV